VKRVPRADLDRLVAVVLRDEALQQRLLAVPQRDAFVATLVTVASERGLVVTADDVGDALRDARRSWLERWV
jgi:glutamate-1-semialdehyde aminotransferase